MALTKATVALDACQEIAQNTVLEGTTEEVSDAYDAVLYVWWALTNATAHTGTKVKVQVSTDTTGDEDWSDLTELVVGVGTTNLEVITNNPAAIGTTAFTCSSTTGYTAATWVFLEDVTTFANSEWLYLTAVAANTSVTAIDGSTREHAANSILNSQAGAMTPVAIPFSAQRVRVIYDNTYDADGATVAIKSQLVEVTAVS
jgi:hypothetical protein